MICTVCNKHRETRLGICFSCCCAESIIADGTDMNDVKIARTPMEKLKAIVSKGWNDSVPMDLDNLYQQLIEDEFNCDLDKYDTMAFFIKFDHIYF